MVLLQLKQSNAAQNQRDFYRDFLSVYNGDLDGTPNNQCNMFMTN